LPDSNLAGAAKILAPIARAARPKARQLYQERRAGQVPFAGGMDFLDKIFDEILDRLRGGITDEGWWKRVCSNVGHAIVAPEFFTSIAFENGLRPSRCGRTLRPSRVLAS
jgi:hypothetical protein